MGNCAARPTAADVKAFQSQWLNQVSQERDVRQSEEHGGSRFLATLAPSLDRDGDGVVTTKEVLQAGREEAAHRRQRVSCLQAGPSLWQLAVRPALSSGWYAPERYLEAAGECFILMIAVSWAVTWTFNPDIITSNPLKDRVGYNNMCVGFDSPPARYVAMPFQVLQAFLAVRYVSLDSARAVLEKAAGRITDGQYWFTRGANLCYGAFMTCFPVLLVVTPDVSVNAHTYLFFAMLIFSFSVVAANFCEAEMVAASSKIWFGLFGAFTAALPVLGAIDFWTYREGQEAPLVPWQLVWMLDWGWFMLLGLTVVFLPDAPALKVHAVRAPWPCSVYTRRFTLYDRAILRTILRCRSFRFALLLARRQAPRTATSRACTECYRSEKPLAVFATSGLLFF